MAGHESTDEYNAPEPIEASEVRTPREEVAERLARTPVRELVRNEAVVEVIRSVKHTLAQQQEGEK